MAQPTGARHSIATPVINLGGIGCVGLDARSGRDVL
jgi:hypothetical protein